jgi:RNA polymerase sigma factor (sigma-70 family)
MDLQQLLKECKQHSAAAQKCLFDLYADRMMVLCCRYVKNQHDAEEVMLDGFYKLFKNVSRFQFKGDAALYAWIKKIMVNECLMYLRKGSSFVIMAETEAADIMVPENFLDNIEAAEILKLIIQLPVGYRTVFNLFAIEGMAHKEIAALLGITEGTSKSQLSKAKQLLQKMLTQKKDWYERRQNG